VSTRRALGVKAAPAEEEDEDEDDEDEDDDWSEEAGGAISPRNVIKPSMLRSPSGRSEKSITRCTSSEERGAKRCK
jgi:hypothetical protein